MQGRLTSAVVAGLLVALACHRSGGASAPSASRGEGARGDGALGEVPVSVPMRGEAELSAVPGAELEGRARFFQEPDGVLVIVELAGAPPGKKGVHVHTRGDCSDPRNDSMGPHFAPTLQQHALPAENTTRHLGDLGNIIVAGDGQGRLEIKVPSATLGADDSTSFLGRSLIVHAAEDTGSGAQPSGGSGAPLACGVIREAAS